MGQGKLNMHIITKTMLTLFTKNYQNFQFHILIFLFIPCGRLSWLPVSFLLHVKYTLSYRIVSKLVHGCRNNSFPKLARFLRHSASTVFFKFSVISATVYKKLSYCCDSSRYDQINDSSRSVNLNRNPVQAYDLFKFYFTNKVVNT